MQVGDWVELNKSSHKILNGYSFLSNLSVMDYRTISKEFVRILYNHSLLKCHRSLKDALE